LVCRAAFGLGFIIGPAVGGLLSAYNLRFPFWIAAGLSLANALYGFFILPESLPPERRAKSGWHMANPFGSFTLLGSHPELMGLAAVAPVLSGAQRSSLGLRSLHRIPLAHGPLATSASPWQLSEVCAAAASGGLVGPYVKNLANASACFPD
jgi:DHA1 family tetracycline resistance protein-like MFS transporter